MNASNTKIAKTSAALDLATATVETAQRELGAIACRRNVLADALAAIRSGAPLSERLGDEVADLRYDGKVGAEISDEAMVAQVVNALNVRVSLAEKVLKLAEKEEAKACKAFQSALYRRAV